ncbi:MAG TPA: DUF6599 family protein [Bacteroidota bacterium]
MKHIIIPVMLLLITGGECYSADAANGSIFPTVAGWKIAPPPGDSVYTPDNLWDIIDGAAELFLSYGFVDLHIMEYTDTTGTDVRVELYRHASRANAFGIYSQERNPGYNFIEIGTQGYVEEKVLNFLCGMYYVKISSHREGKAGIDGMALIGRRVAEHLGQKAGWPATLTLLPAEKRLPNTESYIAENFLGYRVFHSAFTARYEGGCTLFIMDLESASRARGVAEAYMKAAGRQLELTEGEIADIPDPHNGSLAMLLKGRTISGAFGAGGEALAHRYMELLKVRLPAPE